MKETETKWISQQGTIAALKGFSSTGVGVFPEFGAFVFSGQISEFTLLCREAQASHFLISENYRRAHGGRVKSL